MSSTFRLIVLTAFFCAVSIIVIYRTVHIEEIDPRISADRIALERDQIALQREHLRRNANAWLYGVVVVIGCGCLSGLIVASGHHRAQVKQAQVHRYRIGQSEVVIHERDLSLAAPVAMGLITAEQLRQMNGGIEKAFELSCRMAEVQSRQIRALVHGRLSLPDTPGDVQHTHQVDPPMATPTFHDLLQQGRIATGQPLLFGFANGQPRCGTWHEIYSNATGGQSGSGKTNTLLSLIAQSLLQDMRFWIVDYHWPHDESLLAKLGPLRETPHIRYAENLLAVREVLEDVNACLDRRLQKQEASTPLRVLCMDEVLRIVKSCAFAEQMIERIGTEGRKVNIFGLFAAQSWKADKVNTTARDNLTSIFAHYMKPNQAHPLLQDPEKEHQVKTLRKGQLLFCPVMGEPEILTVPYVAPNDLQFVHALMRRPRVDHAVDQTGQLTGLVESGCVDGPVDLVDQVNARLTSPGDLTALAQSTTLDKSFLSRMLHRKQPLSKNAEERLTAWLAQQA